MESIHYQRIAQFSKELVKLSFQGEARLEWCGLRIESGLTAANIARQFVVSRDKIGGCGKCFVTRQSHETSAGEVGESLSQSLCFLLPEVKITDSDYRLTGSVQFEKSVTTFGMHCAGKVMDVPILLFADDPWQRETLRQNLDVPDASIQSMIDIRDSRNCGLWVRFVNQPERVQPKQKRFFGLW